MGRPILLIGLLALVAAAAAAAGVFLGMRDVTSWKAGPKQVEVTPNSAISGTLNLPDGALDSDLSWSASGSGVQARGVGTSYTFKAPARGIMTLRATLADGRESHAIVFKVVPLRHVAGWAAETNGFVTVDGERVVDGQVLRQGAEVDARRGTLRYIARATRNADKVGMISIADARVTLSASTDGKRVINDIAMERRAGATQRLVADVEHLDNTRYVTVTTPEAVAMVKGTKFVVVVEAVETTVAVEHGWVVVKDIVNTSRRSFDVRTKHDVTITRRRREVSKTRPAVTRTDASDTRKLAAAGRADRKRAMRLHNGRPNTPPTPVGAPAGPDPGVAPPPAPPTVNDRKITTSAPTGFTVKPGSHDQCLNIDGVQEVVPSGMFRDSSGNCRRVQSTTTTTTTTAAPRDACLNIDGVQETVPTGMYRDTSGNCHQKPPPQTHDVCLNIDGIQTTVPDGYYRDEKSNCYRKVAATTDGSSTGGTAGTVDLA